VSLGGVQRYDLVSGEAVGAPLTSDNIHWTTPAPISGDGRLVAALDDDGRGWVRDLETLEPVLELPSCTIPMSFNTDGTALVLDGVRLCDAPQPDADPRSRIVEVPSGEELLDLGEDVIWHHQRVVFNPEGLFPADRYVALPRQLRVEIYDMIDGRLLTTLDRADEGVLGIAFDPTGRYLAVGGGNIGGWVIDMEQVAAGADAEAALIFADPVDPGAGGGGHQRRWDTGNLRVRLPPPVGCPHRRAGDPDPPRLSRTIVGSLQRGWRPPALRRHNRRRLRAAAVPARPRPAHRPGREPGDPGPHRRRVPPLPRRGDV
jgi:hypothetical protein